MAEPINGATAVHETSSVKLHPGRTAANAIREHVLIVVIVVKHRAGPHEVEVLGRHSRPFRRLRADVADGVACAGAERDRRARKWATQDREHWLVTDQRECLRLRANIRVLRRHG